MTAGECSAMQATAGDVEASLAAYERHVRQLVYTWLDMDLYQLVSAEIDALRKACAGFPQLSVPWVELLVSHAELVHCLWRSSQPTRRPAQGELQQRLQEHLRCIAVLGQQLRLAG